MSAFRGRIPAAVNIARAPGSSYKIRRRLHVAHHTVLGVSSDATPTEIKRAFKMRALKLHPDIPGTGCALKYNECQLAMNAMLRNHGNYGSRYSQHREGGGPSWAQARRAQADAADAAESDADEEAHEYARMRREAAQEKRDYERTEAEYNAWKMRTLRLLCLYVAFGTVVKYALVNIIVEVRERGWLENWVTPAARKRRGDGARFDAIGGRDQPQGDPKAEG